MIKYLLATIFILSAQSAFADADIERRNLSLLVKEIDFLMKRVDEIKEDAPMHSRVIFKYESLKADLEKIKQGVNDHISKSLRVGRVIEPLDSDYSNKLVH